MKALSLKQPWLWAITDLDKRIENRSWKPPSWVIGQRIALHASKVDDQDGYVAIRGVAGVEPPDELPRGVIMATACVVGFVEDSNDKWFFGPYGWVLDDVRAVDPIPCRGMLGLWDTPIGRLEVIDVRHLRGEAREGVEYVGRAFAGWPESALGNRSGSIAEYRRWLWEQVQAGEGPAYAELQRLAGRVAAGEQVRLGCWCAPDPCHADVVRACVEWMVESTEKHCKGGTR